MTRRAPHQTAKGRRALSESDLQTLAVLAEDGWRLFPDVFAERMSDGEWKAYPWIRKVMRHLQRRVMEGNARIIINAPPRHGKSEGITRWFTTWYMETFPHHDVIVASYGQKLAAKYGRQIRDTFDDKRTLTNVRDDKSAMSDWVTTDGGSFRAVGLDAGVVGHGANFAVIDDPHKDWAEAKSPVRREHVKEWFDGTFRTRIEPGGSVFIVHTRFDDDDLTGHLVENSGEEWEVISLPAVCEELHDDEGNSIPDWLEREPFDVLCEERFDLKALDAIKQAASTEDVWLWQFQQRKPVSTTSDIINASWIRYTKTPPKHGAVVLSFDCSFKETGTSFVVGQAWRRENETDFLLDQIRGKWEFVDTVARLLEMVNRYRRRGIEALLIEEAANGNAIMSTLRNQINDAEVVPIRAKESKYSRFVSCAPAFREGRVVVPEPELSPWIVGWRKELLAFPNYTNDDQVDATSQYLNWRNQSGSEMDALQKLLALAR